MRGGLRDWIDECKNESASIVDKQCQLMIRVEGLASQRQMYFREMIWKHTCHVKALLRIRYTSYAFPVRLMTSNHNSNFSYITNFTASIIFLSEGVWIRWSTQNKDEYKMRGGIVDLTVD